MREKLIELLKLAPPVNNNSEVGENFRNCVLEKFADYLIDEGVTIQKWIPVSERLPERRETVLVCDAREDYMNAWEYLGRDEWLWDSTIWRTEDITHWMPMPEMPKEEF